MFGSRGWVAQDARKPSRTAKSKPITSAATTTAARWACAGSVQAWRPR